jgi:hypothetical protein
LAVYQIPNASFPIVEFLRNTILELLVVLEECGVLAMEGLLAKARLSTV